MTDQKQLQMFLLKMLFVNIKFNYRKLRRSLILYIVFVGTLEVFIIYFAYSIQLLYNKDSGWLSCMLIFWSINTLSMFLSQIILLISAIKQRFAALNYLLEMKSCMKARQLKTISKIHLKLTEVIEIMNRTYCMMAMFFLAGAFCLFNLFLFSLKSVIVMFSFEFFNIFMSKIFLNFYSFTLTMMIIVVSSKATREAKQTIRILFDLLHEMDEDAEWCAQSHNFVQQITYSQTKFSCGLFTYDWSLFFKVSHEWLLNIF